jgi:glyoxylase-like metal-dependent hydrolase (beta-lactamase superfamily II)/rhodanese-related sulfurtransferase
VTERSSGGGTIGEITADELRSALEARTPLTIVDVRPTAERAEWSIPGSLHVDAYKSLWDGDRSLLTQFAVTLPKDRPIVTVCAKGRTSRLAAETLRDAGFDVLSLAGGMAAWTGAWNTADVKLPSRARAHVIQVRRIGKGCLSYIVGSDAQAAVIDPAVDPAVYMSLAQQHGWTITAVLDTHVHADHVSRAYELADRCRAMLYLPRQRRVQRPHTALDEGAELNIGASTLRAISTPGHTHESMCYVIDDAAICSGDTLFLNTVGRPDLAAADANEPKQRAAALFHSLHDRLLRLAPDVVIMPGHANVALPFDGVPFAASLAEVRTAVTVAALGEAQFIETVLARIPPTPPNHLQIVRINEGKETLPADLESLEAGANRCAISA